LENVKSTQSKTERRLGIWGPFRPGVTSNRFEPKPDKGPPTPAPLAPDVAGVLSVAWG